MSGWLEILEQEVERRGQRQTAKALGISPATVHMIIHGKYGASTKKIEAKVKAFFGRGGIIECPELGEIDALECAENFERAKKYGARATGNPETLRLYFTCRKKCPVRGTA